MEVIVQSQVARFLWLTVDIFSEQLTPKEKSIIQVNEWPLDYITANTHVSQTVDSFLNAC